MDMPYLKLQNPSLPNEFSSSNCEPKTLKNFQKPMGLEVSNFLTLCGNPPGLCTTVDALEKPRGPGHPPLVPKILRVCFQKMAAGATTPATQQPGVGGPTGVEPDKDGSSPQNDSEKLRFR